MYRAHMHKFLSLKTGEVIVRRKWTELLVPQDAIDQLKDISGESRKLDFTEEDIDVQGKEEKGEEVNHEYVNEGVEDIDAINETEMGIIEPLSRNEAAVEELMIEEPTNIPKIEEEIPGREDDIENETKHHDLDENRDEQVNYLYNLRPSRSRDYSHKFSFILVKARL
jgi:hypothetical protein